MQVMIRFGGGLIDVRKIATVLLLTGSFIAGLLFLLPGLISTDWARLELGRQLSNASGMAIRLEGPVRLSFIPRLAVVAKDISLASAEDDVSINVPRFSTAITLSSLWSDRFEIEAIALREPVIALTATANADLPAAPSEQVQTDPFASIVDSLERLAVNRVTIENGTVISRDVAGNTSTVSAIDADLRVPDLDRKASFSFAAAKDAQRIEVSGTLSALRPILKRLPAEIAIEARLEPPPAPELSSLSATGEIRLNQNGSYQIRDGRFDIGGQNFRLDALYQPGERHHFYTDLTAKRIDIDAFTGGAQSDARQGQVSGEADDIDFLMLSDFDAEISIAIDELVGADVQASNVLLAATLRDGRLEAKLDHLGLDAGSIAATVSTDVREVPPTIQGHIASSGLDIESMAQFIGQTVPLSGKLTIDTAFAFRGLTEQRIRASANLRGTVGIRDGMVRLVDLVGPQDGSPDDITGLNLDIEIHDIGQPVEIAGNLDWRGEAVAFRSEVAPLDFLSSASIADASGPVSLSIASRFLEASANGIAGGSGTFSGQVSAASPSVDKLIEWLSQDGLEGPRKFSFKGDIDVGPAGLSFKNAAVALNGVAASGEGSVELGGPLTIRTSLEVAELDFAALAGGEHTASDGKPDPGPVVDIPIDLSFLRDLDAKVEIKADKIGYERVFAGPMSTTLVIESGKAHLLAPQSPFYGGTIAAEMTADGSKDVASIEFSATIDGTEAASLLRDAADFDRIEGTLDTTVAITGTGNTSKSLARSLNGSAAVKVSDGALRGINIAEVYNNLVGLHSKGFEQDADKKTGFTELGASFVIENGVAQTGDINLLGPLVRMDGAGRIDLAEQTLDIRLNPRVVASLTGQGGDIAAEGLGVPVVVEGSLSGPRIYPDLSSLLKDPKGALDALSRLGLPTGKLGLDQLIPGQQQSGDDDAGKSPADLIGDLLEEGIKDAGDRTGFADRIDDALPGPGNDLTEPVATEPRDLEGAAKAIIGDLLKNRTPLPEASSEPQEGAVMPADNTDADTAPIPDQNPSDDLETREPIHSDPNPVSTKPQSARRGEIESLLGQLLE